MNFIRMAHDAATCMSYTGIDPFTKTEVFVARHLRDRKLQRAVAVFQARELFSLPGRTHRQDLIGGRCDCLIPASPPEEAIEARRRQANDADHYHTVVNPAKGEKPGERGLPNHGYRPGRKMGRRQDKMPKGKGGTSRP